MPNHIEVLHDECCEELHKDQRGMILRVTANCAVSILPRARRRDQGGPGSARPNNRDGFLGKSDFLRVVNHSASLMEVIPLPPFASFARDPLARSRSALRSRPVNSTVSRQRVLSEKIYGDALEYPVPLRADEPAMKSSSLYVLLF